ncbi:hypothetical protein D3C80_1945050 [compost metagenome]
MGDPEQFLGLVPDDVEIAGHPLQEIEARSPALSMLERREIGGRDADGRGHLLLRHALLAPQIAHRRAKGGHGALPLLRARRT